LAIAGNAGLAHLSQNSISRRLTKSGMHSRVAAIKDILTEEHRAARLHFARRYVHYPIEFWRWVIFTDEKSWSSSAHGQLRVRRQKKTKIQSEKYLFHKKKRQNNSECLGRHVVGRNNSALPRYQQFNFSSIRDKRIRRNFASACDRGISSF
jgi:hypothetical protein